MIKQATLFTLIATVLTASCSCTLLVKPIDKNTHFSEQLSQLESSIRNEDWDKADENYKVTETAWKKLKPWIQVDIDHDYVHEIEENLAKLEAYIDTEEQSDAMAHILMIQETWEDIGSL